MNFLTAFLIIFSIAQMSGRMEYEEKAIIGALVKGGANEQILKVDDKILELDGKKINLWADIPEVTKEAIDKEEIPALIERDGKEQKLVLKLTKDEENKRVVLGISPKSKKTNLSLKICLVGLFSLPIFISILSPAELELGCDTRPHLDGGHLSYRLLLTAPLHPIKTNTHRHS